MKGRYAIHMRIWMLLRVPNPTAWPKPYCMAKTLALIEHIHEMHLAHHELET